MSTLNERAKEVRQKIIELADKVGIITRASVAVNLKLKDTTAWDNIQWLVDNDYFEEVKVPSGGNKGRPKTGFRRKKQSVSIL